MRARSTLRPGQAGTKALQREYGERLLYVRYRYDAGRQRRYKTVEIIVDEVPWESPEAVDETPEEHVLFDASTSGNGGIAVEHIGQGQAVSGEIDTTKEAAASPSDAIVFVRVAWGETELRDEVKAAGGVWHRPAKLWALSLREVQRLRLQGRIVGLAPAESPDVAR